MSVAKVYNSLTQQWDPVVLGAQGPSGPSGVVSVNAPLTNTGTSSSAIIGLDSTVARRDQANTFTNNIETAGGGNGWSSFNYGKNMIVRNTSANPAIGIFDSTNSNPLAIVNSSGTFVVAAMPAITNNTTAPSWRMSIDTEGRVTTPGQPAFAASSAQATTQGNDIIWDQYISQVGTGYNSANGRFTAPVSGYYYFHAHGLWANADSGDRRVGLYKNGTGFSGMRFITYKVANVWHTWFIDGVVYMAAGDYATVRVEQSAYGMHTDANYNQFSGYLLG